MGVSATAAAQGVTLDPSPDKRVLQEHSGVAGLVLAGTADAVVTTVEGRVVRADDGSVVVPWGPIATAAEGSWSGQIAAIPEGGWYHAEVRASGAPSATVATSPRFGVGLVVLVLGQSNSARMFTEDPADGSLTAPGELPHDLTWRLGYGEPAGYEYERPAIDLPVTWGPVTGSGGVRFANALQQATGGPVLVLDYALDWTGLDEHWLEGAGPFVGWSKVVAGLAQVESVGAAVWLQGTYEAVTRADQRTVEGVKGSLDSLYQRLVDASGVSGLPLVVSLLNRGDYTQDTTLDASFDVQRRAQAEWVAERSHGWPGGGAFDLELSTRPAAGLGHFWASGFAELGDRWALGVLHAVGTSTAGPAGPRLVSASVSGRTVTVEVAHDQGSRLVNPDPQHDLAGFEVTQGAWGTDDLAIERAVLSSEGAGNRVILTLAQAPTASARLRYLAGQNPNRGAPTVQQRRGRGNWAIDDFAYAPGRAGLPLAPTVVDLALAPVTVGDQAPSASPDHGWVPVGGVVSLAVLGNDLDPDGSLDPGTVTVVDPPGAGTTTVDSVSGRITYQHGGGAGAQDTFTYRVDDLSGSSSELATVTIDLLDSGFPALAGRVLHLEADRGLETNGGSQITGWRDLSGQGNDVAPAGDPSRIGAGLNGEDCIRFDGTGDKLERTSGLSGLPGLDADRTVFTVGQYRSAGFGGVAWGSPSNGDCANRGNQVFGLIVDPAGLLTVQAWCQDFHSTTAGTGAGWLVQSAVHQAGVLRHFRDGALIDTRNHTFATDSDGVLMLGAELDSSPYLDMDLVAVLVYDRALDDEERAQVEGYLQQKYLAAADGPPVAVDDIAVFATGGSSEVEVLANDSDDLGLDPGSVTIVAPPANGTAAVDPSSGRITYTHDGSATTADALVYTVDDLGGQTSNPATVTLSLSSSELPSAGRVLHLESDSGVDVGFGDEVQRWNDQSPRGNDVVAAGGPLMAAGATPSGAGAVVFDGGNDRLERLSDLDGLPAGNSDRTVLSVVRYRSSGFGGITWGTAACNRVFGPVVDNVGRLATQGWCAGNDVPTTTQGNGAGWLLQTLVHGSGVLRHYVGGQLVDTTAHAFDTDGSGRLVLGAEIDNSPHIAMDVAALLVYDRALSDGERLSAEASLRAKYLDVATPPANPPTAVGDTLTVVVGQAAGVDVVANDLPGDAGDGALDPTTVAVVEGPDHGSVTVDPASGAITYQHDGSSTSSDQLTYTVDDLGGRTSNAAVVAISVDPGEAPEGLPTLGRVLHLESDQGVDEAFGEVVSWNDQSPAANHLGAAGGPLLRSAATPTGASAIVFDGGNDRLERQSSLVALPTGNQDRTVLSVVRYASTGFGGIAWGAPGCNRVFGTVVDNVGNLAVQGWCLGNDFPTTEAGTGAGWRLHTVALSASQLDQWVDGVLVDTRAHAFDTDGAGRLVLGAEIDNFPHVAMEVAAVVIYDRALSEGERQAAETYLVEKYLVEPPPPPVDEPPVAVDDSGGVDRGGAVTLAVLANDSDDQGLDLASVLVVGAPSHGSTTVDAATGTLTYHHDGTATTSDALTYTVADTAGQASNVATVQLTIAVGPPTLPTSGRVLHLESDTGVQLGFGEVTRWLDQSPSGNDVVGIGGPIWTAGVTPSGAAAVVLDGSNDRLERLSGITDLPSGGDDRSLFVVVRYDGAGFGGVGWGSDDAGDCANLGNRAFTLGVDGEGQMAVLGYCPGNDHPSDSPATGAGWMVHSVTLGSGVLRHFRDGVLVDRRGHDFATDGDGALILGAEIDGQPSVAMALAAVVVYDRHLGEAERTAVESYLQTKYLARTYDNPAPVAVDDWRTGEIAATVHLDLLANDLDEGVLGAAAVELVDPPTAGTATVDPVTGAVVYTHGGGESVYDTLTYRITDALGQVSQPATLRLALLPSARGLVLHLDAGLGVVGGAEEPVVGWLDLSDSANDLVALGDPQRVVGDPVGASSVRFDGVGDLMANGSQLAGLPGGNADRTVVLVVRYRSRGFGGLTWGSPSCDRVFGPVVDHRGRLGVQGYCTDLRTQERGNGSGWLVQTVVVEDDFVTHYRDGAPIDGITHVFDTDAGGDLVLAAEIDGAPQLDMDVAMALVYDRALGTLERQDLEDFLIGKLFGN